jgi:cytochrome b
MSIVQNPTAHAHAVKVWDPFVRIFHWSLVTCVALDEFVLEAGNMAHQWTGYVASALVVARVAWGFIGSRHARVRGHLASILRGHPQAYVGHSPLGALMMFALMALVLALGITGWLQSTDAYWGDEGLQALHERLADGLIAAAALHATAAVLLSRLERTRLIRAMITGVKDPL